ncbi:ribbon-helix-helix protein, CopG family [Desulfocurvibacter africanus]|nr:ribbon-helix-helix protein, CopG family [Desulfocurvibacter africanus]
MRRQQERVTVYLPKWHIEVLKEQSSREKISMSAHIRRLLARVETKKV